MGACDFFDYGWGQDPSSVFDVLVAASRRENGNDAYSGTIATKGSYVVVRHGAIPLEAIRHETQAMMRTNWGNMDKWGPALAIPFTAENVKIHIEDLAVSGRNYQSDLSALAETWLRQRKLISPSEHVLDFMAQSGTIEGNGKWRTVSGEATVHKAGWRRRQVRKVIKLNTAMIEQGNVLDQLRALVPVQAGEFIGKFEANSRASAAGIKTIRATGGSQTQWLIKEGERVLGVYPTQSAATAQARIILARPPRPHCEQTRRQLHLIKQVTATNGDGLLVLEQSPKAITYEVEAELIRPPRNSPIAGWCFFGLAPS